MPPGTGPGESGTSRTARDPVSPADQPGHDHPSGLDVDDRGIQPRKLPPWRPITAVAASIGAPASIGLLHPALGTAVFSIELTLAVMIISTALYGAREYSERAFRLLRWIADRPEPKAPPASSGPDTASSYTAIPPPRAESGVSAVTPLITAAASGPEPESGGHAQDLAAGQLPSGTDPAADHPLLTA